MRFSQQFEQTGLFQTLRAEGGKDFQYFANEDADVMSMESRALPGVEGFRPEPSVTELSPDSLYGISGRFSRFDWPEDPADKPAAVEQVVASDQASELSRWPSPIGGREPSKPTRPTDVTYHDRTDKGMRRREYYAEGGATKIGDVRYSPGSEHGTLVHTAEVSPAYRRQGLSKQFMGDFLNEHPDTYADAFSPEGAAAFKAKGVPEIK